MTLAVPLKIVIFGGSDCGESEELFRAAEALGRACAAEGWTVVNGGYGGTMLASARGAHAAGGRTIGVSCSIFNSACNAYLGETIPTDNLYDRLRKLIELGDAYIALPGSTGTLAELALIWELVNKRMLPPRPILCWGDFWRPVVGIFAGESAADPRLPSPPPTRRRGDLIRFVHSVDEAIEALRRAFQS